VGVGGTTLDVYGLWIPRSDIMTQHRYACCSESESATLVWVVRCSDALRTTGLRLWRHAPVCFPGRASRVSESLAETTATSSAATSSCDPLTEQSRAYPSSDNLTCSTSSLSCQSAALDAF
jgi:hypothetical protein